MEELGEGLEVEEVDGRVEGDGLDDGGGSVVVVVVGSLGEHKRRARRIYFSKFPLRFNVFLTDPVEC